MRRLTADQLRDDAGTHLAVKVDRPGDLEIQVHAPVGSTVRLGSSVEVWILHGVGTVLPIDTAAR